jgi:predicted DNA binding CopG/RHH family protein
MPKKPIRSKDRKLRKYYDESSLLAEGRTTPVRMSFPKPRRLVALRLDEDTLADVRRLASEKGINFSTLMRMWITERLRRES